MGLIGDWWRRRHAPGDLIGTWETYRKFLGRPMHGRISFDEDGRFKGTTVTGHATRNLAATDSGSWRLDGEMLTMHFEFVEWKVETDLPSAADTQAKIDSRQEEIRQNANETPAQAIRWHGPNRFSYRDHTGRRCDYRRVKSP